MTIETTYLTHIFIRPRLESTFSVPVRPRSSILYAQLYAPSGQRKTDGDG